jgi:2-polyprenyl-3-methyl-5-hydroxy-6-metoxy-1,4-benzoquinol methylase
MTLAPDQLREKIAELGPWYQNLELADGVWTKDLDGTRDIFAGDDIPGPLWRLIARDLPPDLAGHSVLDIGCNAGYMSFAAKRLGAEYVLGIDANLGATRSFVDQAEFCRSVLGLEVEFREQSFFDLEAPGQFTTVLFCGVLYHLEDYATALDKVASFAAPNGAIVLETAVEPVTLTFPGDAAYHGDTTTFFVPSIPVLTELVRERGLQIEVTRNIGTRCVMHLRRVVG